MAVAACCAVVDYSGRVLYNEYIFPPMQVEDWMGYSNPYFQKEIKNGVPFYKARNDILHILNGKLAVVHHFHHMTSMHFKYILISLKSVFVIHL